MKKTIIILSMAFVVLSVIVMSQIPSRAEIKITTSVNASPIPENVMQIFKTSCTACHSNNGSASAKAMINFDAWDTYPLKKQIKKASATMRAIENGSMPPKSFIAKNPGAALNAEKKATLSQWAQGLSGTN